VAVEQLARAAEVELAVEVLRVERRDLLEHHERCRMVALVEEAAPDREQDLAVVQAQDGRPAQLAVPGQRVPPPPGREGRGGARPDLVEGARGRRRAA
jgi:hypothetical protein